jgi:hypothetical protein
MTAAEALIVLIIRISLISFETLPVLVLRVVLL